MQLALLKPPVRSSGPVMVYFVSPMAGSNVASRSMGHAHTPHTHAHTCMDTYTYIYIYIYIYIYRYRYRYRYRCRYRYRYRYIYILYIHTHTYTHMQSWTYSYMHIWFMIGKLNRPVCVYTSTRWLVIHAIMQHQLWVVHIYIYTHKTKTRVSAHVQCM